MIHVDRQFRKQVVDSAEQFKSAPFAKVPERYKNNPRMFELGTTTDPGFNCSGFVIASICRAVGASPLDIWLPKYRTSESIGNGICGKSKPKRLEHTEVEPGDAIVWIEEDDEFGHMALATDTQKDGEIPYLHATYYDDPDGPGEVCADFLRQSKWYFPVHVPLQKLVNIALKSK